MSQGYSNSDESVESRAEVQAPQITGVTSFNRIASPRFRLLSSIFDGFCVFSIGMIIFKLLNLLPFPNTTFVLLFVAIAVSYQITQRKLFGITLGERIWYLKTKNPQKKRTLYQRDHLSAFEGIGSAIATAITCLVALFELNHTILEHPLWLGASPWVLEPFVPTVVNPQWIVAPFFYQVGSWPAEFMGKPVFYGLTYETGPPKNFVGRIILHLLDPDIQMILEGPKTPLGAGDQDDIKNCILKNQLDYRCSIQRYKTLSRHIQEMQSLHPSSWTVQWFQVQNPSMTEEDQPQGIYLKASGSKLTGETWIQDRFVLINSSGTHQAVILNRTDSLPGERAYLVVQRTIRSLRGFKDLDPGKAWINRELESIHLEELQTIQDAPRLLTQLAQIQSMLISKISVEPASYESYFHLAGTSLILATHPKLKFDVPVDSPVRITALQNLLSSYRFAQDVIPQEPRNTQIESMLLETKKALSSGDPSK